MKRDFVVDFIKFISAHNSYMEFFESEGWLFTKN